MITVDKEQIPETDEFLEIIAKDRLHKKWRHKETFDEMEFNESNE